MGITVWRKIAFNCSSFTCNCLTFSLRRWLFSALCLFRIRKAVDFLLQLYLTQWINPFVFIFLFFFFFVIVMSCYCYVKSMRFFPPSVWQGNPCSPSSAPVARLGLGVAAQSWACFRTMLRMARKQVMTRKRMREVWMRDDFPSGFGTRKEGGRGWRGGWERERARGTGVEAGWLSLRKWLRSKCGVVFWGARRHCPSRTFCWSRFKR